MAMGIVNVIFIFSCTERIPRFVKYYLRQKKQDEKVEMEEIAMLGEGIKHTISFGNVLPPQTYDLKMFIERKRSYQKKEKSEIGMKLKKSYSEMEEIEIENKRKIS